jgi:hypothetical protein
LQLWIKRLHTVLITRPNTHTHTREVYKTRNVNKNIMAREKVWLTFGRWQGKTTNDKKSPKTTKKTTKAHMICIELLWWRSRLRRKGATQKKHEKRDCGGERGWGGRGCCVIHKYMDLLKHSRFRRTRKEVKTRQDKTRQESKSKHCDTWKNENL